MCVCVCMYVCTCSTHIVKVTGVNLRGGEHDTGVSDDRGRVWINTAAPTEEERERIVKQQSPGLVSCPAPPTHPGREREGLGNRAHPACPCLGISRHQSEIAVRSSRTYRMQLISHTHDVSNVQSLNAHGALTKNIQLLTTPCTCRAFHWNTLDAHDSPDPFSRVHEGGWAQDYPRSYSH